MSLINEALKKAQRQRVEEPAAHVSAEPGTINAPVARIPQRRPPLPARTLVILLGGGGSLLVMAGVFVFLFFLSDADPVPPAKPVAVATPPAPAPAVTAPTPAIVAPVVATAADPAPAPAPAPVVAVQLPPIATPAAAIPPAPAVPEPAPAPVAATTPTGVRVPVANSKAYEFLETLRVSGIRVSETDPKVIMNDRVYRLNDLVDRNTKLRLTRVESSTLTFVDDTGFEYRKNF